MSAEAMTRDELKAWVDRLRADQHLPRRVTNPTSLQKIADLMRAEPPQAEQPRAS